jgi:hypothetical protein
LDKNSFFWKIIDGKIPPPPCAKTLGLSFVEIDGERGTVETSFAEICEAIITDISSLRAVDRSQPTDRAPASKHRRYHASFGR